MEPPWLSATARVITPEDDIIAEVKRDCEMIKASGTKGLNLTTAGSINNGSLLTSMRVVMAAIQKYGRY